MISSELFVKELKQRGVGLFTGVPDSLLKDFCAYIDEYGDKKEHIITANEGNAVALAAGYHMATNKIGAVYLQNSGLGNTINPLTSLTDPEVYRIPLLLIVGWRGEPEVKDEPQHVKQGRITPDQLRLLEVPFWTLDKDTDLNHTLDQAFKKIKVTNAPVALLVRKGTFSSFKARSRGHIESSLSREEALRELLKLTSSDDLVVATTGKTSRELFELRGERGEAQRDFLTVGGMGHASSIALGVAIGKPEKRVICFDGDGAMLMHMGALPIVGDVKPKNFIHVILNNECHESVGGQPTVAGSIDLRSITMASGYTAYRSANDTDTLKEAWENLTSKPGPAVLEVKIKPGSRDNLSRPSSTPEENKKSFMAAVND